MKIKYQKIVNVDFFDKSNFNSLMTRLENIQPDAERKWGSMTAAQMFHHLNLAIGSGVGYYQLPDDSSFYSRNFVQYILLYAVKSFPIGTETRAALKVTETFDFHTEKELLKEIIKKAYNTKSDSEWGKHTYFGKMTRNNWGRLILIHCNHHFQQFNN